MPTLEQLPETEIVLHAVKAWESLENPSKSRSGQRHLVTKIIRPSHKRDKLSLKVHERLVYQTLTALAGFNLTPLLYTSPKSREESLQRVIAVLVVQANNPFSSFCLRKTEQ